MAFKHKYSYEEKEHILIEYLNGTHTFKELCRIYGMNGYYSAFGIRKTPPLKKEPVSSPEILSVYFPAAASPSA